MSRETLGCEFNGHFWTREATRGRKPKRCPKHPKHQPLSMADLTMQQAVARVTRPEPVEIICYVDPDYVDPDDPPVTVRSTKTQKEAPESPQEPITPRLATGGRGRGQGASSEPLGGRNGQNEPTPSPELTPDPDLDVQELYCANGDHDWTRPAGRRGRKPVNCPQHPNAVDLEANAEERRRKAEARIDNLEMLLTSRGTHIKQQKEKEFPMPNRPEYQDKGPGQASHKEKPSKAGTSHKGMAKTVRANKRTEAEARNAKTAPDRRSKKAA